MEERRVNIISGASVVVILTLIVLARIFLNLSKAFFLITGAGVAAILAIFMFTLVRRRFNERRKVMESMLAMEGKELRVEYSFLRKIARVPTKFRYKEIEEATDNFRSLVGKGASASVFKGTLKDGTQVAVKRIVGEERAEKHFRAEIAAIASVQHVNLVRLYGYCSASNSLRFLVYDFIPNGSLDKWIFPRRGSQDYSQASGCLSWELRCKVAMDVAKALSYLHHDCRSRVLHLDVKPENILLDENYRAIVSDFGLSKMMGRDESRIVATFRGTRGYLAPEWLMELSVSEKSDVFSYGMVLLEMVGGRRNITKTGNGNETDNYNKLEYFPKIAIEKLREGKVMEVVDRRLVDSGNINEIEVRKMVRVALWCIQEKPRIRPTMAQVVEWLEGRVEVDEPPDTQMIVVDLLCIDDQEANHVQQRPRVIGRALSQVSNFLPSTSKSYSFSMSNISAR